MIQKQDKDIQFKTSICPECKQIRQEDGTEEPAKDIELIPREEWNRMRANDVLSAMIRLANAGETVPKDWFEELDFLIGE